MLASGFLNYKKFAPAPNGGSDVEANYMTLPAHSRLPAVLSLFCGAGGLDWGFCQAGFHIPLAIDISEAAVRTHKRNFGDEAGVCSNLAELGPNGVCNLLHSRLQTGQKLGIIGGPPCQGFSRANVGSRFDDPRNKLVALYIEIVRCLQRD